jgi:hypothetical protein
MNRAVKSDRREIKKRVEINMDESNEERIAGHFI